MIAIIARDYEQGLIYAQRHEFRGSSYPIFHEKESYLQLGSIVLNGMIVLPDADRSLIQWAISRLRFPFDGEHQ
jgi:hypothetical protein